MHEFEQVLLEVESEYDADVFLYSGEIDEDEGYGELVKLLAESRNHDNGLLILATRGGSGNGAYQIARLFQKTYDQFILYTPSYCKSAGTLVALGATRLVMDVFSELGPLDVQLPSKDELWDQRSGLVSRSALKSLTEASFEMYQAFMLSIKHGSMNAVSFKLASEISTKLTGQLMAPIYGQLNPDLIGSDFRDLNVAIEYGRRLAQRSKNPLSGAVEKLVGTYPSHDFIIDDIEARSLFRNVEEPKPCLYGLIGHLGNAAYQEQDPPLVLALRKVNEVVDARQGEGIAEPACEDDDDASGMDEGRASDRPSNQGADARDASQEYAGGEAAASDGQNPTHLRAVRSKLL